jgi:hypothetical protein
MSRNGDRSADPGEGAEGRVERLAREAVELILAREVTRGASLAHALRVAKIVASLLLDNDAKAAPIMERAAEAFAEPK